MRETQSRVNDIFTSNTERGVSEEELVEHQDQIIESAGEQANNSVKTSFILEQIADKEKIEVSQEEVLNRVDQIAARQTLLQRFTQGLPGLPISYMEEQYRKIAERLVRLSNKVGKLQ